MEEGKWNTGEAGLLSHLFPGRRQFHALWKFKKIYRMLMQMQWDSEWASTPVNPLEKSTNYLAILYNLLSICALLLKIFKSSSHHLLKNLCQKIIFKIREIIF